MTKMTHFLNLKTPNALYTEHNRFIKVIQGSLHIHTHSDLFHWLQGDLQTYLPHQILLFSWRGAGRNALEVDIISALLEMRTSNVVNANMMPLRRNLLARWEKEGHELFEIQNEDGFDLDLGKLDTPDSVTAHFKRMRSALIHGIKDERERDQILYVVFNQALCLPRSAQLYFKLLLPYIDTALRQLPPFRPQANIKAVQKSYVEFGLSLREKEVMDWVRVGKTNEVIGVILNISPFTVKNHLKRIFRKLDVSNRAQAVSKIHEHAEAYRAG